VIDPIALNPKSAQSVVQPDNGTPVSSNYQAKEPVIPGAE